MKLTISKLREEAIQFCKRESAISHEDLVGITDGKAIGTYIEHKFEEYLKNKYEVTIGSSGKGIDLPDTHINTDIKVTSNKKPQSSSPFKNIEQKIYGLGHNLLIFVYEKNDVNNTCYLDFKHCIFIETEKTGDYTLTKTLREIIKNGANKNEIISTLKDRNIPGEDLDLVKLAQKIILNPPKQGYLTISNAFQWRLKYNNVINLENEIEGIYDYDENYGKDLGEYQTPLYLTDIICEYLKNNLKISPDIIIEPTCGIGNFLKSISKIYPKKQLYGIEIDKTKLDKIKNTIPHLKLINEDIFTFKFSSFDKTNSFLIIGNPPRVTRYELLKTKSNISINPNFKNLKNNDIKLDNANFDISEYIILKIINEFKNTRTTMAFLCEKTVPRNIFIELIKNNIKYSFIKQINFNSYKKFNLETETCLFIIQFGETIMKNKTCEVCDISNPSKVLYKFGFLSREFYIDTISQIDEKFSFEWKQGVKHDCAKIIELTLENNQLVNKNNYPVNIENLLVYPLLKGGDLKNPIVNETSKYIIITQQKTGQDTTYIKSEAPKTWQYLNDNIKYFNTRKSNIYKNTSDFCIFSIGKYSFKKYKVAISSFNKNLLFSLVYCEKIMMLDNACYFLSFENYDDAYITMLILNSQLVKRFLKNIVSLDSKRPFSKKILKRIDFDKCLKILKFDDLKKTEKELRLDNYITPDKFDKYKKKYEN